MNRIDKVQIILIIITVFVLSIALVQTTNEKTVYRTVTVVSVNQKWQGDTAPYENVTLSNGKWVVFSCDYYHVNSTITYNWNSGYFLFFNMNGTGLEIVPARGC